MEGWKSEQKLQRVILVSCQQMERNPTKLTLATENKNTYNRRAIFLSVLGICATRRKKYKKRRDISASPYKNYGKGYL